MNEAPAVTTIKISLSTWQSLTALKERPGDSMDDVVRRLVERREKAQERP